MLCPSRLWGVKPQMLWTCCATKTTFESRTIIVAQKPKRTGRPKLPKGEAKSEVLRVRVPPILQVAVKAIAKKQGKEPSELLREAIEAFLNQEASILESDAEYERSRRRRRTT
jgi:hypothetical protein